MKVQTVRERMLDVVTSCLEKTAYPRPKFLARKIIEVVFTEFEKIIKE